MSLTNIFIFFSLKNFPNLKINVQTNSRHFSNSYQNLVFIYIFHLVGMWYYLDQTIRQTNSDPGNMIQPYGNKKKKRKFFKNPIFFFTVQNKMQASCRKRNIKRRNCTWLYCTFLHTYRYPFEAKLNKKIGSQMWELRQTTHLNSLTRAFRYSWTSCHTSSSRYVPEYFNI